MIQSYFKIALRNLRKNKLYSGINLFGLCLGMACSMIIVIYILDELSYDAYHKNGDRIFRVVDDIINENSEKSEVAYTMAPLAGQLKNQFAVVQSTLRVYKTSGQLETPSREKVFVENNLLFADSTFFDFFTYTFIEGNPAQAFINPFSLVITSVIARKYFGSAPAMGKILKIKDDETDYLYTITGVIDESNVKSHLDFDVLGSMSSLRTVMPWFENWYYPPIYTYLMTTAPGDKTFLAHTLKSVNPKIFPKNMKTKHELSIQPLKDIHIYSQRETELEPNGNATYLYVFGLIAFLVLFIASLNFTNMSLVGSISRKKEIGIRKTFGAERGRLLLHFLGESLVLTVMSFLMSLVLLKMAMPSFNQFLGRHMNFDHLLNGYVILTVPVIILLVTLISGGYPAIILSSYKPSAGLKDDHSTFFSKIGLQKALVVAQFVISIFLIVSTTLVYRQLKFMQNKELGFSKDHIVIVPLRDMINQMNYEPLKKLWMQHPEIINVTASSAVPTKEEGLHDFEIKPKLAAVDSIEMLTLTVDYDFIRTYGMEIISGRDFSKEFPADATESFLINESAAKRIGWKDPLNKELHLEYFYNKRINKAGKVVGIIKDFHYQSLRKSVDPLILHMIPGSYYNDYLSVKINGGDIARTIDFMQKEWIKYNASRPFEYTFLDDYFDQLYKSEEKFAAILFCCSLLAICIACVGLFALVAFMCTQRTKEVGIRKILGATVLNIVTLLTKDILILVLFAVMIAIPLSVILSFQWLKNFAYRVDTNYWVFAYAVLISVLMGLMTVSFHAFKSGLANPIKSIRSE